MFDDDNEDWVVPNRHWSLRRGPVLLAVAVTVVGVLTGVVFLALKSPDAPPPEPVAVAETGLTPTESRGVRAALERFTSGAHRITGKATSRGVTLTLDLTYTADRSSGAGTVTAGTVTGEALLDVDVVFMRGPVEFWQAMRVTPLDTEGSEKTWVAMDPRFMNGDIFQSAEIVADDLSPTPTAKLAADGAYKPGEKSEATARLSATPDVVEYAANGVEVKVVPVDPASVPLLAAPLLESRTEWATIAGDPDTSWRLNPPGDADRPPPADDAAPAG